MEIRSVPVGGLAVLEWNGEPVQVIDHWQMCSKIRSLRDNSERSLTSHETDPTWAFLANG